MLTEHHIYKQDDELQGTVQHVRFASEEKSYKGTLSQYPINLAGLTLKWNSYCVLNLLMLSLSGAFPVNWTTIVLVRPLAPRQTIEILFPDHNISCSQSRVQKLAFYLAGGCNCPLVFMKGLST